MDTAPTYFQEQIHDNEKRLTLPIFLFLVYVVCTFFPHVYTFFPLLGTMKVVRVAGILLVVTYVFTRERYHNITAYKHPIFIAWVVFMIILPFGLIYSWDRGATLNKTQEAYKYFLVFLIMIRIIDSSKRLDLIMAVFAACAVGMALGSLFSGIVSAEGRTMSIDAGIFADPNDLCFLLNCALPFLLHLFLKSETKIIPIAGTAVVLTAVVLTFSRGGFLGLCMVGFGYTLFIARKSKKYLAPIFAAAVLIWFFSPTAYKERMSTITDFQVDNETGLTGTRIDTWLPAIKWGLEHPITGKGAGSTVYFNGMTRGDWHVTHNSLVQVFVGTGVIGFTAYIMLFVIPFWQHRAVIRKNVFLSSEDILRMRIIMISFFSYGTTAFFLPQGYSPILYLLTGFYLIQAQLIFKSTAMAMFFNGKN